MRLGRQAGGLLHAGHHLSDEVMDRVGHDDGAGSELLLVGAGDGHASSEGRDAEQQRAEGILRGLRGVEGLHVGNSVPGLNKLHVVSGTQKEGCPSVFVALAHSVDT